MALQTWKLARKELPPEDTKVIVITPSGEEFVMFYKWGVWHFENGSMYVCWEPVFWREHVEGKDGGG